MREKKRIDDGRRRAGRGKPTKVFPEPKTSGKKGEDRNVCTEPTKIIIRRLRRARRSGYSRKILKKKGVGEERTSRE